MRALALLAVAVLLAGAGEAAGTPASPTGCAPPHAGAAYTASVLRALRAGRDVWGERALAAGDVTRRVAVLGPLLLAGGPGQTRLTDSGFHYVALSLPQDADGARTVALHVADGSEVIADHVGGRTLAVEAGAERFGSCFGRLAPGALAEGWLPILETRYADAAGNRYTQESFAGGDPLASFVRVSVHARHDVEVRLAVSDGAAQTMHVPAGESGTIRVAWSYGRALTAVDERAYDTARAAVRAYWIHRLARDAAVVVPDETVTDAWRALLVQEATLSWRYSVGNPYEELSFPEALDVAQVTAEWGDAGLSRHIIEEALTRRPTPYPDWKKGEKLVAAGVHYRLFRDRGFIARITPVLRGYVADLRSQLAHSDDGLLTPERYSSDIADTVQGLHTQTVVWEGLELVAAAWRATGFTADARVAADTADRLAPAVRAAVVRAQRRLPDGSLFVPVVLDGAERPYGSVTETRLGSYWNLVMPYALASGLFAPGGAEARGIFSYLRLHGSRLLGLVRAGAYALYGRDAAFPAGGTDEVYGINVARFLADNGEFDQLGLSLYGQLAVAMTPGTFVGGEASEVAPKDGSVVRAAYLPPNAAANAAFLTKLRLMLVHETRAAHDEPTGLELAYGTPRAWLKPGRRVAVERMPTSGGPVSFDLRAAADAVHVTVRLPARPPRHVRLRLRTPGATRVVDLSGRRGTVQLVVRMAT